uniref:ARAD1A18414p n=1 Tax=Blastobotrys adeninivorans TaxID=409370 RepID=A0A060T4K7_BLAAD
MSVSPQVRPGEMDTQVNGKRIACIECRQQKVRCDAHERWPGPCSRCAKKKSECVLQPEFKRTSKRRRLEQVEREMEDLKRSLEIQEHEKRKIVSGSLLELSNPGAGSSAPYSMASREGSVSATGNGVVTGRNGTPPPQTRSWHHNLPEPSYIPKEYERANSMVTPTLSEEDLKCSPKTIESLTLTSETIKNLFVEFVNKYHPFLPVVDVSRGPERIYRQCPSLFWTIMAVASRRYDKDGELMLKLAPLLKTCLSEITISPTTRFISGESNEPFFNVASVYSVQSFLIYTMWPPLTSSISADSSWNMAGIATFSAIRVGLHCPGYAKDFGRIKADNPIYPKISEQIRTWTCCNIVAQTVATVFGFPSFTSFDASVVSACNSDSEIDIPEQIRQMMAIQHLESEIERTLNSNLQDPLGLADISERLSLIQLMARKLDTLELNLGRLDDIRRFGLLAARVHLMTYYFFDAAKIPHLQHQKGMIQAYNASLALIEHAEASARRSRDFIKYIPSAYVQTLWQTTAIITRIYHSPFAEVVDTTAGKSSFRACVHLISRASLLKHDMAYRASEIMPQLWQIYGAFSRRGTASTKLSVRTRMAASVFFDSLWAMREECGIRSVAPTELNQRNVQNDDEDGSSNVATESNTRAPSTDALPAESPATRVDKLFEAVPLDPKPLVLRGTSSDTAASAVATPMNGQGVSLNVSNVRSSDAQPSSQVMVPPPHAPAAPQVYYDPRTALSGSTPSTVGTPAMSSPGVQGVSTPKTGADHTTPNSQNNAELTNTLFDWDADMVFRDVDLMMADFGFRAEEVAL